MEIAAMIQAAGAAFGVTNTILNRVWGNETQEEAKKIKESQAIREEFDVAVQKQDVVGINTAHAKLLGLLDEAIAVKIGQTT